MNGFMLFGLSKWFYLGVMAVILGCVLIYIARDKNNSKTMENGYFIFILGWIGIIAEWTDFATVLFIFVIISGTILLLDKILWSPKRSLENLQKPHYVHYAKEFFPVVLAVWILRAFLFEAYQIPSSSMRPDLTVGDFILVNKFDYGIREPFTNKVIIPIHQVKRGDIIVFSDQQVRNRDLIKRVIGLAGDKIEYYNKHLTINGKALSYTENGSYNYSETTENGEIDLHNDQYIEDLVGVKHPIITLDRMPPVITEQVINFKNRENCIYKEDNSGFTCTVPEGHYFMMGDNRDNSLDGRYWGFVPEKDIIGRAFYIWMNFHDFSRLGTKIH